MFLADRPNRYDSPGECIVIAGRHHDEKGGVQLDGILDGARGDMRLWISYAGLHSIVRKFGDKLNLATAEEAETQRQRAEVAERERDEWLATAQKLQAKLERINGVTKDGFKIVRQQGRTPTKKAIA